MSYDEEYQKRIKFFAKYGFILECVSPFEIRHEDGSFASGYAAELVEEALKDDASARKTRKRKRKL